MTQTDVLFLHSFGLDGRASNWLGVDRVIAPTLPNHGSDATRTGLTIRAVVDEIADGLSGPVDVVGCSIGGMFALHLALDHPELVRSLVLSCTAAWVPRQMILDRADETESAPHDEFMRTTLERWFLPEELVEPTAPVWYAINRLATSNRAGLAEVWRTVAEHDVRSRLAEITVPTTCIGATEDVSSPVARSEEIRDGIPGARLTVMSGAHMAYLEQPERFSEHVREHLRGLDQKGTP